MITIKENILEKISTWTNDSIYILADFDRTITSGTSVSSWGVLSECKEATQEYIKERKDLYNTYRPLELDQDIEPKLKNKYMEEWHKKHINLLIKYKFSEDIINNAATDKNIMSFRPGAKEFLETMYNKKIPIIIISAGIGNFIEQFLKTNNCYYENITIVSNFIKFENGNTVGISGNIIHALNKNESSLPIRIQNEIKNRPNIILIGDSIGDVKMVKEELREDTLKIGFLDENIEENKPYFDKHFDIVCTDNTDYNDLLNILPILKD